MVICINGAGWSGTGDLNMKQIKAKENICQCILHGITTQTELDTLKMLLDYQDTAEAKSKVVDRALIRVMDQFKEMEQDCKAVKLQSLQPLLLDIRTKIDDAEYGYAQRILASVNHQFSQKIYECI